MGGVYRVLAEGGETALLYVRFRAAAEPGLKGAHRSGGDHIIFEFRFRFRFRTGAPGGVYRVLAEGAETALLYVRFRAAAEPGLKGAHRSGGNWGCIVSSTVRAAIGTGCEARRIIDPRVRTPCLYSWAPPCRLPASVRFESS